MTDTTTPTTRGRELTLRAILLGGLLTLMFTAANVYLGLKVGLTFATSIPAAVISMALLRYMAGSTILENNIVQTIASAAGTLAAIIFVLPGLVMVGYWQGFPLLETTAITMLGGILGVLFSVPLRRALVVDSDLPYPEGRAAAEVLQVGAASAEGAAENKAGLSALLWNSIVAAGFTLLTQMKLAGAEVARWFAVGSGATGIAGGLAFALFGVGHLVGLSVGMAQLVGLVTGWWVLLPILTQGGPGDAETLANTVFRADVRFFGAGVIAVAAIWTLVKIAGPVLGGIRSAMAASRARQGGQALAIEEQDMSIAWVFGGSLFLMLPIGVLLWSELAGGPLAAASIPLIAGAILFIIIVGLMIASVTGYMAGLIGASNSPVSGIGILAIIASSLLLLGLLGRGGGEAEVSAMVAYALIVTGLVFGIATISNDNLQDLKTGQLVGATPWKQQVALIIGVIFGSIVVPPVLNVLNETVGFVGAPGAGPNALAAPQAGLISSLAQGVLGGDLNWTMLGYGALAGIGFILVDELLGRAGKLRLPPLAIGIGIYLPMAVILPVVIGAVGGWFYDRWASRRPNASFAHRMGVLTATGMIVGESLFGVFYAGAVYATDNDAPLAVVGDGYAPYAPWVGLILFAVLAWHSYKRTRDMVTATP
ncbi:MULTISPECIES: OPT family oligopeptide transporter [unclassified Sphingopyxis]|uniref:OPT family oligopeptide transporter n=1 Tax=unclassified Sphingopyxis TaxID=2614943 RepID=UPI0007371009|nr:MULTISPECIES: oligopeptide transporter, OPT family [unclassified Sphingopyxis]KTE31822.1 peptide transporter [Sphingopyxis sp. HIX]KTE83213.1 peptide transporter [Sphingopyxis sp. HXXIV]